MLTKKYFNVNFWKGISCYIMVFLLFRNPRTHTALFYYEYQGITGISVFIIPYVPNQQQLSGIYSCLEVVNLYTSL